MAKPKYIVHATINTGHRRNSPRSEVSNQMAANAITIIRGWLQDSLATGHKRAIIDDLYAYRIEEATGKYIIVVIERLAADMAATDIIRFAVCRHSLKRQRIWERLSGSGEAPPVPYCAVELLPALGEPDLPYIGEFGDFERLFAWAWLDLKQNQSDNQGKNESNHSAN